MALGAILLGAPCMKENLPEFRNDPHTDVQNSTDGSDMGDILGTHYIVDLPFVDCDVCSSRILGMLPTENLRRGYLP